MVWTYCKGVIKTLMRMEESVANNVDVGNVGLLSEEEYFMSLAVLASKRSRDPHMQVGACIVGTDGKVVSTSYNDMPRGCLASWKKHGNGVDWLESKKPYVVHAEVNAIIGQPAQALKGSRLYVTHFPCNECGKTIVQAGVAEVIYLSTRNYNKEDREPSRRMFDWAGVIRRQFQGSRNICLELKDFEKGI